MREKIVSVIKLPWYILIGPFWILHAIFIKNSRQDWLHALPWFAVTIVLLIFALLALDDSHHNWMGALVDFVGLWPYMELLTLIVTPIFMWWLDPADDIHPKARVAISVGMAALIIGGTPAYLHFVMDNLLFVIAFLLGRMTPLLLRSTHPTAKDREAETLRLGFAVIYLFFLLLPAVAVVISIWNSFDLDFYYHRYLHYFLASASYFFVMGCIELNLRAMVDTHTFGRH